MVLDDVPVGGVALQRQCGGGGHRRHPRQRRDARQRRIEEVRHRDVVGIAGPRQRQVQGQRPGRLEAGIDRGQPAKAVQHQDRAGEQHQRQRQLQPDQHLPQALPAAPHGHRPAASLELGCQLLAFSSAAAAAGVTPGASLPTPS